MNNRLRTLAQLYHTIKYLKVKQVVFRIYYKFVKPKNHHYEVHAHAKWRWSGLAFAKPSIVDDGTIEFLNVKMSIASDIQWNDPGYEKLWLYNLHYFDDLNAMDSELRTTIHRDLIQRWVDSNDFGCGNGWEPYPLSLRIVNLVKWMSRQNKNEITLLRSLSDQTDALLQQIEYHILGNHVFANAKALIFAGAFLEGQLAHKARSRGIKLLNTEIAEQFLEDGAHFELSPMYHCILLWDILELIHLAKCVDGKIAKDDHLYWVKTATLALEWLTSMLHPDGDISFFNDAAFDIAPSPRKIFEFADLLGIKFKQAKLGLVSNKASGYARLSNKVYTVLFDHANVGPDYLPGHAHADSLSVEVSVGDQRVFVNSGTSVYGVSKERLRQRQTASHNTVVVEGQDSSEVWSGFRVARRAYTKVINLQHSPTVSILEASHDGYKRLKTPLIHTRKLECYKSSVKIRDVLSKSAAATFYLHLHPSIKAKLNEANHLTLELNDGRTLELTSSGELSLEPSTWHPRFGVSIPNKRLTIGFKGNNLETVITIIKAPI